MPQQIAGVNGKIRDMEGAENNIEQFDQYINNELDAEAKKAFEDRLTQDDAFLKAFENFKELEAVFQDAEIISFKEQLGAWDEEQKSETKSTEHKPTRVIPIRSLAVAASIAIITFFGIQFFLKNDGNDQLAQTYFSTYDNVITVRGAKEDIDEALVYYDTQDYKEAINLLKEYPENITAQFYLGESYMASEKYDLAIQAYSIVVVDEGTVFSEVATFHLALAYLGMDDAEKAKTILSEIPSGSDYYQEALEVLEDLK